MKKMLSEIDSPQKIKAQANIVERVEIENSRWNLRPFYYMEDIPKSKHSLISLSDGIVEEVIETIDPRKDQDKNWKILEVSQNGIFLRDTMKGYEATQSYKVVRAGDIAYNPYRINIGSVGVVPSYLDQSLVSPAYVVVRSKNGKFPPSYLVSVLKHPRYLRVIMNYSLSSARACLPFEELIRINIPKPTEADMKILHGLERKTITYSERVNEVTNRLSRYVEDIL